MRRFLLSRTVFPILVFAPLFVPVAFAQIPPVSSTTATPIPGAGHDYLGGLNETVNPATGSVSFRLPVIMPPGRGITLPFSFAYDSNGVNYIAMTTGTIGHWQSSGSVVSSAGWSNTAPVMSDSLITWTTTSTQSPQGASPLVTTITCHALINFVFQDADGNHHNLNLTNYSDPGGTGPCTINSQDWPVYFEAAIVTSGGEGPILGSIPSGWSTSPSVGVVDGDGTGFSFGGRLARSWLAGSVADRNGNNLTINATYPAPNGGTVAFSYVDTTGRTVLQDSGFAQSPETVTVSGLGAAYTLTWTALPTPTFSTPITVLSGSCSTDHPAWSSVKGVSNLTLPNGKSYSFTFDSVYGLVNKMTYPSGGYVRYVWGMNANAEYASSSNCSMEYGVPVATDRYVSFDGTHEVLHQHFGYSTTWGQGGGWTTKQTTVTTYDLVRNTNFQTVYTYLLFPADTPPNSVAPTNGIPVESSIAYYDTSGALLKTVTKGWGNVRLLASQQNTFPNGQLNVNKTTWSYDANEMPIEQDDYDFGNGAPGSFLRATVTNYATSTAMTGAHVLDKPSSVIVYSDSAKTVKVAETDYTFDTPAGTVTSGIVSHSGGCNCGNVTKTSQWINSSGTTSPPTTPTMTPASAFP